MAQANIDGHATREGTKRIRDRQPKNRQAQYRSVNDLTFSALGMGTYLGEPNDETDLYYKKCVIEAVKKGVNVFDSAINYRHQRSERAIGQAIHEIIDLKIASRDELIVSTKGGFLSFDSAPPSNPREYFLDRYIRSSIIEPNDIVAGCHCMHPKYLRHELNRSLENLRLKTIDIYYLHNVEMQLGEIERPEFQHRLALAFESLEKAVDEGKIACFGLATWDSFRVDPSNQAYLSIEEVLKIAREVGGDRHHFRVVQLPFNLMFREAQTGAHQMWKHERTSFLGAAKDAGLAVMASVPLFQGRLLGKMPLPLQEILGTGRTDAQRALTFSVSAPGITSALSGMSQLEHVTENASVMEFPSLELKTFINVLNLLA